MSKIGTVTCKKMLQTYGAVLGHVLVSTRVQVDAKTVLIPCVHAMIKQVIKTSYFALNMPNLAIVNVHSIVSTI